MRSGKMICQVDAADIETSNWVRWINCPRYRSEENVLARKCYGKVYYQAIKDIAPGTELMVYYGHGYARRLGINVTSFMTKM